MNPWEYEIERCFFLFGELNDGEKDMEIRVMKS